MKNKEYVRALKRCKKYLWDGRGELDAYDSDQTHYICFALDSVAEERPELEQAVDELCGLIHARLQGYSTLGSWLFSERGIRAFTDERKLQRTRHRWVDALIKEFS